MATKHSPSHVLHPSAQAEATRKRTLAASPRSSGFLPVIDVPHVRDFNEGDLRGIERMMRGNTRCF